MCLQIHPAFTDSVPLVSATGRNRADAFKRAVRVLRFCECDACLFENERKKCALQVAPPDGTWLVVGFPTARKQHKHIQYIVVMHIIRTGVHASARAPTPTHQQRLCMRTRARDVELETIVPAASQLNCNHTET